MVKISDILNIANLSAVGAIKTVTYGLYNIGSVETEGNAPLHLKDKDILELPHSPDGVDYQSGP